MRHSFALSFVFVLLLSTPIAFATSVYSEYAGAGDLYMMTIITSSVRPTIIDTVESHTACGTMGECCPNPCIEGEGGYEGFQSTTNDPMSWSVDEGYVDNGCLEITEDVIDYNGDQTITSKYSTGVIGTGYAYSWVSSLPLMSYGYQYAEGSGDTWAYFTQTSETDGLVDFETSYIAGTVDCNSGYVWIESEYDGTGPYMVFSPILVDVYCDGVGEVYTNLHASAGEKLGLNASLETDYMSWFLETNTEGSGVIDIDIDGDEMLNIDFDMVLA